MADLSNAQGLAQGINVSQDQGTVTWGQVLAAGYAFAFIKATDGETYTDPLLAQNWAGAQAAGLLRGAYQFFRAEDDPQAQAEFFGQTVGGGGGSGELPLVVDVEESIAGIQGSVDLDVFSGSLAELQQAFPLATSGES
jgi:lysozyme